MVVVIRRLYCLRQSNMTVYYEVSWAILSTIGLANILFGLTIIGITSLSPVTLIPIIVSAAGAVANGLCYYAFYADYPPANNAAASATADLMWMVQEAGISFYSYAILVRVLRNRDLIVFTTLFWTIMLAVFTTRILIIVTRVKALLSDDEDLQYTLNRLHVGYFASIAFVECVNAFFLLRKFASAKKLSTEASLGTGLFRHLMRSTEIRLATLALIGITRAVTYFFQPSLQKATNTASQVDRFVYTFECLFPVMIFIDILASKLVFSNQTHDNLFPRMATARRLSRPEWLNSSPGDDELQMFPVWSGDEEFGSKGRVEAINKPSSRNQDLVRRPSSAMISTPHTNGIRKTLEFSVY